MSDATLVADRTQRTRQKATSRIAAPKPRNPLVVPARKRVAGPHRKSASAERSAGRLALKKSLAKKEAADE